MSLRRDVLSRKFKSHITKIIPILEAFSLKDLKRCGATSLSMNLTICGDKRMRTLNRSYRNLDKTTDVLSFSLYDDLRSGQETLFGPVELGDIFISWPKVLKQANEFKVSPEQELIHLIVHGYLHLLGYDHELSQKEEILMEKYEQDLVKKIYKELKWSKI